MRNVSIGGKLRIFAHLNIIRSSNCVNMLLSIRCTYCHFNGQSKLRTLTFTFITIICIRSVCSSGKLGVRYLLEFI